MSYDPEARRDTPLALKLKARIRRDGPIPVRDYMQACLADPDHGYYRTQAAIGAAGDFVTAPEISQVFGELIGLWSAVVWQQLGQPPTFNLVEYGPGRGTLMADALRALRRVPACLAAARIRLIEPSPVLRQAQQHRLAGDHGAITWHAQLAGEVEALPTIALANELLDTFPIAQWLTADRARERGVGLDETGQLQFCSVQKHGEAPLPDTTEIHEECWPQPGIVDELAALPQVAALFIDYGHLEGRTGDTLQAIRNHAFEHPLTSPGEADLTAQVDFQAFGKQCRVAGLVVDGPVTQAQFLGRLGIVERASRLMAANPAKAGEIEAGVARLMSPQGMGSRFKAIGVRSPGLAMLPGLEAAGSRQ